MRICIYGAGAIGGFLGTRFALAGLGEVSAIARGETARSLRAHGWRLQRAEGGLLTAPATVHEDPSAAGPQDLVVVAVKGPALAAVAEGMAPLLGAQTLVLPAMNGVPWWFGAGQPALGDEPLQSVDPGGRIAAAIPLARVVGCVVHLSSACPEPGLVAHRMGNGLIIGEPAGGRSDRTESLAGLLRRAGFEATVSAEIRRDIWFKLWGNLTMNPVSALTGATADRVLDDPLVRRFCTDAMREAAEIGARVGCSITQQPEDRHAITRKLGAFRTSMLQDVEAGRAIELDAIVGVVHEMGRRLGLATPNVDALLGLTRLFGQVRGLYPPAAG